MDTMPVIVWSEIPVKDLSAAQKYYANVLKQKAELIEEGGREMVRVSSENSVGTDLYVGETAKSDMVLHFFVPGKLEDAMDRVTEFGGTVESPAINIPQGRFAYTRDPDGNRIGLFEVAA